MKKCLNCGKENNDSAKFCIFCGESLSEFNLRCPRCNEVCKPNSKVCPKCGYRFTSISTFETQSITLNDQEVDEAFYESEQRTIREKAYNLKIKEMNKDDKVSPNKAINEYSEDFSQGKSAISSEKMLGIEKSFNIFKNIGALVIFVLGLISSFLPLVYVGKDSISINFIYLMRDIWGGVEASFTQGLASSYLRGIIPLLEFILLIGLMAFSLASLIYGIVKTVNSFRFKNFKSNLHLFVLIDLLIYLFLLNLLSLNFSVTNFGESGLVFFSIGFMYIAIYAFYSTFKACVVKEKRVITRRVLMSISLLFTISALFILSYKCLTSDVVEVTVMEYLNYLLRFLDVESNNQAFNLVFVMSFVYPLNSILLGITSFFLVKSLTQFNRFKVLTIVFSILSFITSFIILILLTLSTMNAFLPFDISMTVSSILIVVSTVTTLLCSILNFLLFKDDILEVKTNG